jgi:phosphatidylserine decarboxylase
MWIIKFLPRKKISKWVGRFAFKKFPKAIQNKINLTYAQFFGINLNETEFPYYDYNSLGDFFIRRLKAGARPLGDSPLVHPCDSRITERGKITNSQLIQAKGIHYSLERITEIEDCRLKYNDGYFITYYLSPKDYHRVHSPVDGLITQIKYSTGDLWPVNDWSIKNIPQVYAQNERIYVEIATEFGPVGVIFVGATNVGSIALKFEKKLFTNWKTASKQITYEPPIEVKKGEEIGMFKMGSTIVVIYNPEWLEKFKLSMDKNTQVRMGQNFYRIEATEYQVVQK